MPHIALFTVLLAVFLGLGGTPAHETVARAASPVENLAAQLYLDADLRRARIPPVREGQIRLYGALNSHGKYSYNGSDSMDSLRGCSWKKSRFGVMGHDPGGGGSAWFYADVDAQSGRVLTLTAYGNGSCGHYSAGAFFVSSPQAGGFGTAGKEGFALRGTGIGLSEERGVFDRFGMNLVITGVGNLLNADNGAKIPVRYYLSGGDVVLADRDASGVNTDSGTGTAIVELYGAPARSDARAADAGQGLPVSKGNRLEAVMPLGRLIALFLPERGESRAKRFARLKHTDGKTVKILLPGSAEPASECSIEYGMDRVTLWFSQDFSHQALEQSIKENPELTLVRLGTWLERKYEYAGLRIEGRDKTPVFAYYPIMSDGFLNFYFTLDYTVPPTQEVLRQFQY